MAALSDDFNRADNVSLGASWTEIVDGAEIVSNDVVLTGANSLAVHNTALAGVSQYVKFSFSGGAPGDVHVPWAVLRYSTAFYTVRFAVDGDTVSWYSHTSSADVAGTLIGSAAATVDQSDTWGCTIDGTGNASVVRAWKAPSGNIPDNPSTWGGAAPTVTLTNDPGTAVDTGSQVGFGHTTANPFAQHVDNWFGGDTPSGIVLPTARTDSLDLEFAAHWRPERWDFPLESDFLFDDFLPSAASPGAISGTAAWTWSQSGDLKGAGALSGSIAWTWGQSGTLRGSGALSASTTWTWSQSGTLGGAGTLSGTIAWQWGQSGTLAGAGALAGTIPWTWSQSATLLGAGALSGTIPWTWSQSGDLQDATPASGAISGTASWTWDQSGDLKGGGALAATASWQWGQAATLGGSGALAGTSVWQWSQSASLDGAGALSGLVSWTWDQSGTLINSTPTGDISGTAEWTWGASGDLTNITPIEQSSLGGQLFDLYDEYRRRQRLELEEIEERERLDLEIQNELDRQIAEQFRAQELLEAKRAEAARLARLAELFAQRPLEIPPHVLAAVEAAAERKTYALLLKMQQEIDRMYQEEAAAVMAALMLDDD